MKSLFAILALFGGYAAQADVLTLTSPSPYAVIGRQCGTGTTASTATGFTADGFYLTGLTSVSTRCGGSGRGGGYHTTTYSGCGVTRWDLVGRLIDITSVACSAPDPAAVFTSDGYTEETASSRVILVRPDVLPTYAWTAKPAIFVPAGQLSTITGTLIDTSAVPLHIYSVQATGSDVSGCTGVDLQPGASCDVVTHVYPSGEGGTSFTLGFSATTDAASEVSSTQTLTVLESEEPDPPPAPQVPALPPLALRALALALGMAGRRELRRA
jgi:hypothetical protein